MPAATASIIVAAAPLVSVAIAALFARRAAHRHARSPAARSPSAAWPSSASHAQARAVTSALWIAVGAAVVQGIYHPLIKPLLRTRSGLEVATYAMVAGRPHVAAAPAVGLAPAWSPPPRPRGARRSTSRCCPPRWGSCCGDTRVANLPMATSTSLLYLVPAVRRAHRVRLAGRGAPRRRAARRPRRDRRCRARRSRRSTPSPASRATWREAHATRRGDGRLSWHLLNRSPPEEAPCLTREKRRSPCARKGPCCSRTSRPRP